MTTLIERTLIAKEKLADVALFLDELIAAAPQPVVIPVNTRLVGLQTADAFWNCIRGDVGELFPKITQQQVDGVTSILEAAAGRLPRSWCAYCLATAYHETNRTMAGVREAYWTSEEWRKRNLRYYPWYGRGLVQLTWEDNYKKAGEKLDIDLIANPDLALVLKHAVDIMIEGMLEGWFTGKKLRDYIPADAEREHYKNARRIINGTDKADLIAGYAVEFDKALKKGNWQ